MMTPINRGSYLYPENFSNEVTVEQISDCEKIENPLASEIKVNLINNPIIESSLLQSLKNAAKMYQNVDDLSDLFNILLMLEQMNEENSNLKRFIFQVLCVHGNYEEAKVKLQEAHTGKLLGQMEYYIALEELNAKKNNVNIAFLESVKSQGNLEQALQKRVKRLLGDGYYLLGELQKSSECYLQSSIDFLKICRNDYIESKNPRDLLLEGIKKGYLDACKDPKMLAFAFILFKTLYPDRKIPDVLKKDYRLFFLAPTIIEFIEKLKGVEGTGKKYKIFLDFSKRIEKDYQTYCVNRFSKTQPYTLSINECEEKLETNFNIVHHLKSLHSLYEKKLDFSKAIRAIQLLQQLETDDDLTVKKAITMLLKGDAALSIEILKLSCIKRFEFLITESYKNFELDKAMKFCHELDKAMIFPNEEHERFRISALSKGLIALRKGNAEDTLKCLEKLVDDELVSFSKAVAHYMLNEKVLSKKYLEICQENVKKHASFTLVIKFFAMSHLQDIKIPDAIYRYEMVFFQDALDIFFQNAQIDFKSAYLEFERQVEKIYKENIVDLNFLKKNQSLITQPNPPANPSNRVMESASQPQSSPIDSSSMIIETASQPQLWINSTDPVSTDRFQNSEARKGHQKSKIHFTIDPKYLGYDRKLVDVRIGANVTGEKEWLNHPALKLNTLDEIKKRNNIRFQRTIETPFFSGTYFTLNIKKTDFDPSQRRTFVLAGRKADAKIPQEAEGGNVILVIPKEDLEVAKHFWLANNRDLLCIQNIKEEGTDENHLRLVNTRRRVVFSFAKTKKLEHFLIIDDNIDSFYLNKSKCSWKELYELFQTTAKENKLTSLSAKSYRPENDKGQFQAGTPSISATFGYKIFFIDAKKINECFDRPDKDLFPPSLDLWGGDVFCQLALYYCKNMGMGAIERQHLIFTRSKKQQNLCKKSIKSAKPWLKISDPNISELNSHVVQLMKKQVVIDIAKFEAKLCKINHSNLAKVYKKALKKTEKKSKETNNKRKLQSRTQSRKPRRKKQKIEEKVKLNGPLRKSHVADKIADIISTLEVNQNCNTNTFNLSYVQMIISQVYRKCQQAALTCLSDSLKKGERMGYIKMPTGAGKTKLINTLAYLLLISQDENKNVLVLSPTIDIVEQTYHSTMKFGDLVKMKFGDRIKHPSCFHGIIPISHNHIRQQIAQNNETLKKGGYIAIACDKSFTNFLGEQPESLNLFSAVFIDEMHTMPSELLERIKNHVFKTDMIALGFSATPSKKKIHLGNNKIYKYPIKCAIEDNILCPAKFHTLLSSESEILIEKLMQDHPHGGKLIENKGIIYVSSIPQAMDLENALNSKLNCGSISKAVTSTHGPLHTQNAIQEFKKSNGMNILIAVDKLKVGFNAPVDWIIFAKKISKKTSWKQMIGRALRNHTPGYLRHREGVSNENKKIAYIITRNDSKPPKKYVKSIKVKDDCLASKNQKQRWFPGCGWQTK